MTHCLVNHHIIDHVVFVLVSREWVMVCPVIDILASCEIHMLNRFIHTKNMTTVDIHHELCASGLWPYCKTRRNCKTLVENVQRYANKCSQWRVKWTALKNLWKTVSQVHNFRTFMWISKHFMHCSLRDYHRLGYQKFCTIGVPKMLTRAYKTQRMASFSLNFLKWCHKDGKEFLYKIVQVTGEKIWVSFVSVKTKNQLRQWMHTPSPDKSKSLNRHHLLTETVLW
jgi:hypothetical protein